MNPHLSALTFTSPKEEEDVLGALMSMYDDKDDTGTLEHELEAYAVSILLVRAC